MDGKLKPFAYEPGDVVECTRSTWTVLGRKLLPSKNDNKCRKEYLCQCHKCGSSLWKKEAELLSGEKGKQGMGNCGVCFDRIVISGKNDVATTHPELVRLFRDPEDALHINHGSREKRWFKCPDCGHEFETCVEYVTSKGRLCCPMCSDGISYPNKFLRSVLTQLNVDELVFEFYPDWGQGCWYDAKFEKDGRRYLIEMDGGFHYMERFGRTEKQIVSRDRLKDQLAEENGYIIIRVECQKSSTEYIRERFEKTIMSDLYDLSIIDWVQVEKDCASSLLIQINNYYLLHPNASLDDIGKEFSLCKQTVQTYLKRGAKIGINNYETLLDTMNKNYAKVIDYKKTHMEETYIDIGKATGVEPSTVRNYLVKAQADGIFEIIDAKEIKKNRVRQYIKDNYDKTNAQLSREVGCCTDYIRQLRREIDIA